MLNHAKLMHELERVADKLFVDHTYEAMLARTVWSKIADDPTFAYKIKALNVPWLVPSWSGRLDDFFPVTQQLDQYRVLAVDGSQIYPDRHQGTACFLINIGVVQLNYGVAGHPVFFDSVPTVFTGDEDASAHGLHDLVDCYRQEFEFCAGLKHSLRMKADGCDAPSVFLFDGSIIFWHLESKEREIKERFLASYIDTLQALYESRVLFAGYISLTKSKELVNLVRIALTELATELGLEKIASAGQASVDHLSDAQIVRFFLQPFTRTILFKNHSSITKQYPAHLHPHFFYVHVGNEIARIEIPAWIANDAALVDKVARMVMSQSSKGHGYPVALAESHEQAVVKGADREFFYNLVWKVGRSHQRQRTVSRKSRSKRCIRI